ncbi:hypothetical protein ADILRU_2312 [Leifsonia rubra CMS 76R]|nr:hypothetical protein ADILRU_2312 [Leifsonia rubra CMS 76R]
MNSFRAAASIAVLAVVAPMLAGCAAFDPQSVLTLRDVMNSEYDPDVTTQVEDTTGTACVPPLNCVQEYSTAEADYFRFDSREDAELYAESVQDGFVVNFIVMDFAGKDASVREQLNAMRALAGMWNDYEGDFPDRR